jgi:hypothetical protein
MAGPTRFELATSGVTGRRSNQLNYDPTSKAPNHNANIPCSSRPIPCGYFECDPAITVYCENPGRMLYNRSINQRLTLLLRYRQVRA